MNNSNTTFQNPPLYYNSCENFYNRSSYPINNPPFYNHIEFGTYSPKNKNVTQGNFFKSQNGQSYVSIVTSNNHINGRIPTTNINTITSSGINKNIKPFFESFQKNGSSNNSPRNDLINSNEFISSYRE